MDSLGHQYRTKQLSPKITLHFKMLCESKETLIKCPKIKNLQDKISQDKMSQDKILQDKKGLNQGYHTFFIF